MTCIIYCSHDVSDSYEPMIDRGIVPPKTYGTTIFHQISKPFGIELPDPENARSDMIYFPH